MITKSDQSAESKTILVTGASRGIGAATVSKLLSEGIRVIAHASGRSNASDQVSEATGMEFLFEDLSKPGAGERLFQAAMDISGRIDGIVNNAAIFDATPLDEDDQWARGWERTMAVNVQAPADISKAAISHFRAAGKPGRIVNIASRAAHRGDDIDHAAYAASKAALIAMTKTWARALGPESIVLYAISPGWVDTRMAPETPTGRAEALSGIPLGRMAEADEIAALVSFLMSDACPSATGSTFDVNGASYVR